MAKIWYYLTSIFELLFGFENWPAVIGVFLGLQPHLPLRVRLKHPRVDMLARSRMDIWSIKETFIDRFYTKYGCEIMDGWTVVDIGAAIGEFSIFAGYGRLDVRVIAYEPFMESVNLLKQNLFLNRLDNITVIPKAVWKTNGRLELDLSAQEPLQIISHDDHKRDKNGGRSTVQAISLNEVLKSNHLKSVDLLKMDCEGAEFDILLDSEPGTIRAFRRIVMEYHDGQTGRHHSQLVSHLEQLGYQVVARCNVVHPEIGYLFAELNR